MISARLASSTAQQHLRWTVKRSLINSQDVPRQIFHEILYVSITNSKTGMSIINFERKITRHKCFDLESTLSKRRRPLPCIHEMHTAAPAPPMKQKQPKTPLRTPKHSQRLVLRSNRLSLLSTALSRALLVRELLLVRSRLCRLCAVVLR